MSDRAQAADALITRLVAGLRPTSRLSPAWKRASLWLGASAWLMAVLALFADFGALATRLTAAPDMWLATSGGVLTAILAAVAAHLGSIPGRSLRWAALPLPALLLWMGASAAGCMRSQPIAAVEPESPMHPMVCFYFILLAAAPLAVLLIAQLTRACPLRPRLTATLAGLASAAAAVSILTLIHPFDANRIDLVTHFTAVALVVGLARWLGPRWMARLY